MDLVGEKDREEIVEDFIDDVEAGEGIVKSWWRALRQFMFPIFWKGLFFGFGNYLGYVFCKMYVVERLNIK